MEGTGRAVGGCWASYLIWGLVQGGGCSSIAIEGVSKELFGDIPASSKKREGHLFSFLLGKLRHA